jgi:hypothetical protein
MEDEKKKSGQYNDSIIDIGDEMNKPKDIINDLVACVIKLLKYEMIRGLPSLHAYLSLINAFEKYKKNIEKNIDIKKEKKGK